MDPEDYWFLDSSSIELVGRVRQFIYRVEQQVLGINQSLRILKVNGLETGIQYGDDRNRIDEL